MGKNNLKTENSVIIVCAGSGTRSGLRYNKIFYPLGKKSVLDTTIDAFLPFGRIILVVSAADFDEVKRLYPDFTVILGGETRTDSVKNGLAAARGSKLVAIHDAVRPFVTPEIIKRAFDSADKRGSGIAVVKSVDAAVLAENNVLDNEALEERVLIKNNDSAVNVNLSSNNKLQFLKKEDLYCIQTPQCFRYGEIVDAYRRVNGSFADDSEVYAAAGYTPGLVEGSYLNKKLTNPKDFIDYTPLAKLGSGFDVHQLVAGRRLLLGGVEIPFEKGLLGHSDADVLAHALTDALLSAAGEPDIGVLFPDSDEKNKNANSLLFLISATDRLSKAGLKIANLSCVLIAQQPRLSPHIPLIRQKLADTLKIDIEKVNVSATTTEFLGIVGEGRAIAASAAVLCCEK